MTSLRIRARRDVPPARWKVRAFRTVRETGFRIGQGLGLRPRTLAKDTSGDAIAEVMRRVEAIGDLRPHHQVALIVMDADGAVATAFGAVAPP